MDALISKVNLDLIIDEFNKAHQGDYRTIRNVLRLCPKNLTVAYAYHCAKDVECLMKDRRSLDAMSAVKLYLGTGTPVSKEVVAAAYAACADAAYADADAAYADVDAAYAASAVAYAACADAAYDAATYAYAASVAASAAYAAADAKKNTPEWRRVRDEKLREHLNKLKEMVLAHVAPEDKNFMLELAL